MNGRGLHQGDLGCPHLGSAGPTGRTGTSYARASIAFASWHLDVDSVHLASRIDGGCLLTWVHPPRGLRRPRSIDGWVPSFWRCPCPSLPLMVWGVSCICCAANLVHRVCASPRGSNSHPSLPDGCTPPTSSASRSLTRCLILLFQPGLHTGVTGTLSGMPTHPGLGVDPHLSVLDTPMALQLFSCPRF